ncbi:MAG: hypothetical protein ACFFAO_05440 [Candidatus Hermodarchaeota archaeon]
MFLFKEQDEIEIPIMCKLCFKEIKFKVSADEYRNISEFPFKREHIHGIPEHKLIVYINKNLEIENFTIKELTEPQKEEKELTVEQQELTKQLLSNIDLSDEEIELYFRTSGRDVVSLGELAILINKPKEECKKIADRFIEKGLFKDIPGATPHYAPLPPYAALVSQLQKFHDYISNIKDVAPVELNKSFSDLEAQAGGVKQLKDYTDFINDLKQNTLSQLFNQKKDFDTIATAISQIGEISTVITNLEGKTKGLMDDQIGHLTSQFKDISTKISSSMKLQIEDLTNQYESISKDISNKIGSQVKGLESQFKGIKDKISKNLEKLRLGVLQQAVDQVVEMSFADWIKNISESLNAQLGAIEKVSKDGLVKTKIALNRQIKEIEQLHEDGISKTTDMLNTQFIAKLKEAINNTVDSIKDITSSTARSGEDVKDIFVDISKKFSQAVTMAEEKLGGISENVFGSFENLKGTFSTKIVDTLNNLLNDILERLEVSEKATSEFWDQAKTGGGGAALTMKDIWFVRSIEGAKAHINDQISKAKMRILIVAPEITDINLDSVKACKSHINVRIAAQIDPTNTSHKAMVNELSQFHNVTLRNRRLKNLWGINKDYEEVVLCVLSESEFGTEIAGIGSIIQEHIKIFVPILEDAWMGAQKDVAISVSPSSYTSPKPSPKAQATPAPTPKIEKPSITPQTPKPIEEPKPSIQKPSEVDVKPVVAPKEIIEPKKIETPIEISKPEPSQKIPPQEKIVELTTPKVEEPLKKAVSSEDEPLSNDFNDLTNNLRKLTGKEIANKLDDIRNIITETRGYSGVLKPINLTITTLKFNEELLSEAEVSQIVSKIDFWRKKLNV